MNRHKLLIRCDAAPEIGFGHVVRCLALADELRDGHCWQAEFAMIKGEMGFAQVQAKGYVVHCAPTEHLSGEQEGAWLQQLVKNILPQALLLDVRTDLTTSAIQFIRASGVLIVTIDDPSERRLAADLAFYPPVPQVEKMDWTGFCGECYVGWEWVLLRKQFAGLYTPRNNTPPVILVTMGGSDPANFTGRILRVLDGLPDDFETIVVIGAGFVHRLELQTFLAQAQRSYRIDRAVHDMATLMRNVDLAIASFGVTAYELAASGTPAIFFCLSKDHARSASKFINDGLAVGCGDLDECSPERISQAVCSLLDSPELRHEMGCRACAAVDGQGATRIASKIMEKLERRSSCHG
jgi:spore coat polysaccharide biosynthesis protein SpsF